MTKGLEVVHEKKQYDFSPSSLTLILLTSLLDLLIIPYITNKPRKNLGNLIKIMEDLKHLVELDLNYIAQYIYA